MFLHHCSIQCAWSNKRHGYVYASQSLCFKKFLKIFRPGTLKTTELWWAFCGWRRPPSLFPRQPFTDFQYSSLSHPPFHPSIPSFRSDRDTQHLSLVRTPPNRSPLCRGAGGWEKSGQSGGLFSLSTVLSAPWLWTPSSWTWRWRELTRPASDLRTISSGARPQTRENRLWGTARASQSQILSASNGGWQPIL